MTNADNLPYSHQVSMFPPIDLPPTILDIAKANASELSAEFMQWLPDNLHVWDAYVSEVFKVIRKGFKHYSSRTIIEVIRHHSAISDTDGIYKINDHSVPYLSRLFDMAYPQHKGLFEYRTTTKEKAVLS